METSQSDDSDGKGSFPSIKQSEQKMEVNDDLELPAELPRAMTPRIGTPVMEHNYGLPCPHCPAPSASQCFHNGMIPRNPSPMPYGPPMGPMRNIMVNPNHINELPPLHSPTEQQLVNGRTPDKETVIEITKLANT